MKTKIISFVEEINERLGYIVVTVFKHLDISRTGGVEDMETSDTRV
jgi:hypothetical protein